MLKIGSIFIEEFVIIWSDVFELYISDLIV